MVPTPPQPPGNEPPGARPAGAPTSVRFALVPWEEPPDEDDPGGTAPLPPDDRLWRHPSEMGVPPGTQRIELVSRPSFGRILAVGGIAFVVGSAATLGILAAAGTLEQPVQDTAIERVATQLELASGASALDIATPVLPAISRVDADGPDGLRSSTAVVIRDDGYLLTTSDAVDGATSLQVWFSDGSSTPATLIGRDRDSDVAVVKVERTGLPVASLPSDAVVDRVDFGATTVVVDAAPTSGPTPSLAEGFVSEPSSQLARDDGTSLFGLVQITTAVPAAEDGTGRVLVDGSGALLGIVTNRPAADDVGPSSLAIQYATPIDHAKQVFDDLIAAGRYDHPMLGVTGSNVVGADAERLGVRSGLLVQSTDDGGPAAASGMRRGDVIVRLGNHSVTDLNDLVVALRRHHGGDVLTMTYVRQGEQDTVDITVAVRPAQP